MKFACFAYGDEKDWNRLSKAEQDALLANDTVLRERGELVLAVKPAVSTVRAPAGKTRVSTGAAADSRLPLAGLSIVEAPSLDEAVRLVEHTPCAVANGAIEVREVMFLNDAALAPYTTGPRSEASNTSASTCSQASGRSPAT